jgi:hypothetical protein
MPARFVGEFGLGREMPQGNREPFFNPNNRQLDAGELCFEAIDAGVAHKPSIGQQLHKSSAVTKQSGSSGHRDDDNLSAVVMQFRASASSLRCSAAYFCGLDYRTVDPHDLPLKVKLLQSAIVVRRSMCSFERANFRGNAHQQPQGTLRA